MNKIIIIGSGGAGKSVLARQMGEILGLPVFHLDALFWHPGWVETPRPEWEEKQKRILANKEWIIDGNYGGTMDLRLEACDTVVFLNFSRMVCLFRVLKRYVQFRGKTRPDMGDGCQEKLSLQFIKWIWDYPKSRAPKVTERVEDLSTAKTVVILKSPKAVQDFIEGLQRAIKHA
ncbi:MAG: DNA topology modulation protein [Anaerolineae bacterium]|nr:DNA topology modulation protein [Anaerolineae bacterium]